jgi:methylmalonyl-CoA/ethylmalonyl-CoA epimerase
MSQGALAHIALLVRDLDQAVADWTRILEVLDPEQLQEPPVVMERFGPESDPVRWVTFVSPGGAEIQLVQPLGDGPRAQWLAEHGECVDHVAFVHPDPAAAARALDAAGVELTGAELSTDHRLPWQGWTFVTQEAAHGARVEIAFPYRAVDGRWEPPVPSAASDTQ